MLLYLQVTCSFVDQDFSMLIFLPLHKKIIIIHDYVITLIGPVIDITVLYYLWSSDASLYARAESACWRLGRNGWGS